jgi:hypothetical protein
VRHTYLQKKTESQAEKMHFRSQKEAARDAVEADEMARLRIYREYSDGSHVSG